MKHNRRFVIILALMIFVFNSSVMSSAQTYGTRTTNFDTPSNIPTSGDCDLDWIIYRSGHRAGVDPRFIHAVITQESRYKDEAISQVGAQGLMQLMPATAKRFGNKDPYDAASNVEAGTKYLKWLLKRFNGDVDLALAGYYAGEGAVDKYKGVPPYDQTRTAANGDMKGMKLLGFGEVRITQSVTINSEGDYDRLIVTDSISVGKPGMLANRVNSRASVSHTDDPEREGSGMGRVEVLAVNRSDGREVQHKRIYYAPKLNPNSVRKYRQPSSPTAEMLPVGGEFTFWVGDSDDQTPLSDKVTITVHPNNNAPVKLQLKNSVASAK